MTPSYESESDLDADVMDVCMYAVSVCLDAVQVLLNCKNCFRAPFGFWLPFTVCT